eukprot:s3318_g3.t1
MNTSASASSMMTSAPPSFQDVIEPTLTLTVQISKTKEVLDSVKPLRESVPRDCAVALVAFDRTVGHLENASKKLHTAQDRAFTLLRAEMDQHQQDFGRLPLLEAD